MTSCRHFPRPNLRRGSIPAIFAVRNPIEVGVTASTNLPLNAPHDRYGVSTTAPERHNIPACYPVLAPFVHSRINAIGRRSHAKILDDFGCGGSRPGYDQHGGERSGACRSGHSCARAKLHADRQTGCVPGPGPVLRARLCQSLRPISLLVPSVQLTE